jgi:single-strand DNA-binding protein
MSSASTVITGNVVNDPAIKFVGEAPKLEFTVASDHRWQDASGEWQSKTSFVDVVAWRGLAEDLAGVLEKGVGVLIAGRLEQRSWEDKESGAKRSKIEIVATDGAILARSIESFVRRRRPENAGGVNGGGQFVPKGKAQPRVPVPANEPF